MKYVRYVDGEWQLAYCGDDEWVIYPVDRTNFTISNAEQSRRRLMIRVVLLRLGVIHA